LLDIINHRFLPDSVVLLKNPADQELDEIAPFVRNMTLINGKAAAYLCEGSSCRQPVTDGQELIRML